MTIFRPLKLYLKIFVSSGGFMPCSSTKLIEHDAYSRSSLTGEVFLLANPNPDVVIENVIFTSF